MRTFLCGLLTAAVLLLAGSPSGAAVTMDESGAAEIGVYARVVVIQPSNQYEAVPSEGVYTVTTNDGAVITVKPEHPSSGLRLVVYQVTPGDSQAYRWFEHSTSRLGKDRRYYELTFVDSNGRQVDGGRCTVTITLPSGRGSIRVDHLDTSGTLTALSGRQSGRSVTFTIRENGYYVLSAVKAAGSESEEDSSNPPTGDNLGASFGTMLLSACALLALAGRPKEKTDCVKSR